MADNLISPDRGKNQNASNNDAKKNKRETNRKKAKIIAVFGIIEIFSLVLWQKADDFSGFSSHFIHSVSECGFLSGGAYLGHEFVRGKFRVWIIAAIWLAWGMICLVLFASKTIESKPDLFNPNEYDLLSADTVSNIVQVLKEPDSHSNVAAILVHAVNPDESAYAFSKQLEKIFKDGRFVTVDGTVPDEISEVPGISCVLYGGASGNAGLVRGLELILTATKSHSTIEISPKYSGQIRATMDIPDGTKNPIEDELYLENFVDQTTNPDFTNSVVVIMIRKK